MPLDLHLIGKNVTEIKTKKLPISPMILPGRALCVSEEIRFNNFLDNIHATLTKRPQLDKKQMRTHVFSTRKNQFRLDDAMRGGFAQGADPPLGAR